MLSKQLEFYKRNFETQFWHLAHFFEKTALRNIETRFSRLACFTRKLRCGLYANFQNDFGNIITAWWITWIATQWLPNCHKV